MAKYVEYKIAKSFKEILENKKGCGQLYELFTMCKDGYNVKRYLCTVRYDDRNRYGDALNKERIRIAFYSKTGQTLGSWSVQLGAVGNSVTSDTVHYYNEVWTLSRDIAYSHCLVAIKNKITGMKKKAMNLHDVIYAI